MIIPTLSVCVDNEKFKWERRFIQMYTGIIKKVATMDRYLIICVRYGSRKPIAAAPRVYRALAR
jgi:hypothetical protein